MHTDTTTISDETINPTSNNDTKETNTMYALQLNDFELDTNAFSDVALAPLDWTKARCRDGFGTLTHLFFSDDTLEIARAKAICGKCPLASACLDDALERAEPWGVWGGELIDSGRIVTFKRPRGRPPKSPRPELVVTEDPFVTQFVA